MRHNSNDLPARLQDDVDTAGLTILSVLHANDRKAQFTLLVEDTTGVRSVFKWRGNPADLSHERAFYTYHTSETRLAPTLLSQGPNWLRLSYHEGQPLHLILRAGTSSCMLEAALSAVCTDYRERLSTAHPLYQTMPIQQSLTYLGKLMTSGPMNTSRSRLEEHVARCSLRVARYILARSTCSGHATAEAGGEVCPAGLVHGDLHANNILVAEHGDVRVVDWEDWFFGDPRLDLLYLFSIVLANLSTLRPANGGRWREEAKELIGEHAQAPSMLHLMVQAARSNRRFVGGSVFACVLRQLGLPLLTAVGTLRGGGKH